MTTPVRCGLTLEWVDRGVGCHARRSVTIGLVGNQTFGDVRTALSGATCIRKRSIPKGITLVVVKIGKFPEAVRFRSYGLTG